MEDDPRLGHTVEQPSAFSDVFERVERRIKALRDEKNELEQKLEQERLKVTGLEQTVDELMLIKEKHLSFVQEQEIVRGKVEGLLSLLETEED